MQILQDLPRSPQNLSAEFKKYLELILKYSPLTTLGDYTWTSPSSSITYPATSGEQSLLTAIETQIDLFILNADKWNGIQDMIDESLSYVYTDLEETRALVERQINADVFVNKTGYGAYTLFDSLSDNVINSGSTTATISTSNKNCTWNSSGMQVLQLLSNKFNINFNGIRVRISGGFNSGKPQVNYTNTNSVSLELPNYALTTSDKLYAYSVSSSKYKEIGINNVTGGSIVVDKTTPVNIITPASGRNVDKATPSVLANGKTIKAFRNSTTSIEFYIDDGTGNNNTLLTTWTLTTNGFSMFTRGNIVHVVSISNSGTSVQYCKFDATMVGATVTTTSNILTSQTAFDGTNSLDIFFYDDNNGAVVASSTNSTYPNSFNLVFVKTTNGGSTWTKQDGTAGFDQLTTNSSSQNSSQPNLIFNSSNLPVIHYQFFDFSTSVYTIKSIRYTTSWQSSVNVFVGASSNLNQSNPTAILKKFGSNVNRIVVKWNGLDATDNSINNQRIAYTDDSGASYTLVGKITTGNTYNRVFGGLCEDLTGTIYGTYYDPNGTSVVYQTSTTGATWGGLTIMAVISVVGTQIIPTCKNYNNFEKPLIIYSDTAWKFYGKYTVGGAYNIILSENVNMLTSEFIPVTTQFTVKQGSTIIPFETSVQNQSMDYVITNLNTDTANISILGKSTVTNTVAYVCT